MKRTIPLLLPLAAFAAMLSFAESEKSTPDSSPAILPRETWATSPRDAEKFEAHSGPISQIVLHHSGAAIHLDGDPKSRINNSIRSWHMEVEGQWGDVAYHYILDTEGNVYEGRPETAKGRSFTQYDLDRKLLICVLGDYRPLEEKLADLEITLGRPLNATELAKVKREDKAYGNKLSEPLKKALIQFVSAKANEFGLTEDQIKTHRQIANSSCPGSNYQGWFDTAGLPEIEKRIAE